jgi:peptide/nickel transport system ATP-binding protein
MTVLSVRDLSVSYGAVPILHGVSLDVAAGECVGVVGESGCGKSTLAFAAMRYLPRVGRIAGGHVIVNDMDVTAHGPGAMRPIWARDMSMVYQDASRALNPTMTILAQVSECFALAGASRAQRRHDCEAALARVRINDPARVLDGYPNALSGGMQQRVVIAMALVKKPALLVLDEPTTGLDATVEAGILDMIDELRRASGMAILLISHNMSVMARMADRTVVLYAGVVVEQGPTAALLAQPRHPYTARLLQCLPRAGLHRRENPLETIAGGLPPPGDLPAGCVFAPRCDRREAVCETTRPPLRGESAHAARCLFDPPFPARQSTPVVRNPDADSPPVLIASQLSKTYRGASSAVLHGISLELRAGETLGLIGESGSGKTTLARLLLGLAAPDTGGTLTLDGQALAAGLHSRSRAQRKALQIIFQNPDSALNRAQTIRAILRRPLRRLAGLRGPELDNRLQQLVEGVRLAPAQLAQRPRALSGGLKQRVAMARAFAGDPRIVICDEPTSALDVSVQAAILNLLNDLQRQDRTAYVFISHDLNVVRYMADRVAVLYRGQIVESGPTETVFGTPAHPYTAELLAASGLRRGVEHPSASPP